MKSPIAAILRSLSSTPKDPGLPQTMRERREKETVSVAGNSSVAECLKITQDGFWVAYQGLMLSLLLLSCLNFVHLDKKTKIWP